MAPFAAKSSFTTIANSFLNVTTQVERDEGCQRVIKQRMKDGLLHEAQIVSNVEDFTGPMDAEAEGVAAGFPCQATA